MNINDDFLKHGKLADIGRWYVTRFVMDVAERMRPEESILDAGAGECVYKRLFVHCDYKSIDLGVGESAWNYGNLDFVGPLHDMPIPDASFDAVLSTQVLEHLEWPRESVREMYRVLKPGGRLYLTAPMSHSEHQVPYDFFRYTSYGLKSICHHAGFREVQVKPFGGMWTRWAYESQRALTIFPSDGIRSGRPNALGILFLPAKVAALLLVRVAQIVFLQLERFDARKDDPFGWSVQATK